MSEYSVLVVVQPADKRDMISLTHGAYIWTPCASRELLLYFTLLFDFKF